MDKLKLCLHCIEDYPAKTSGFGICPTCTGEKKKRPCLKCDKPVLGFKEDRLCWECRRSNKKRDVA